MPTFKPNSDDIDDDLVNLKQHMKKVVQNEPLIVAVTGHVGEVYEQKAISSGMDAVLGKPPCETSMK